MPTATLEEYLEAIYRLDKQGPVRPTALAEAMGVSAPTVTATLKRLSDRGLVSRDKGAVVLTADGRRESLSILRSHRLAERLLVDILGFPWDDVHEDACLLEHALSPRVQEALERVLEYPERCPHGHPIPTADLSVDIDAGMPLSEMVSDTPGRVVAVDEHEPGMLTEASRLGLVPGASVTVVAKTEEWLTVTCGEDGERHRVTKELALRTLVEQRAETA